MKKNHFVFPCLLMWLCVSAFVSHLNAATFQGQVIDAETGFPIERAQVVINNQTANPPSQYTTLFGFFEFNQIPSGNHTAVITRGGYAPANLEFSISTEDLQQIIELEPLGAGTFDVTAKVACVMTGLPIPNAIVTATRVDANGQASGGTTPSARTDATGFAMLQGFSPGRHTFEVQPPSGWLAHQGSSAGIIQSDHNLTLLLKPNQEDLNISVTGFDPVTESVTTLENVIVEVTGLDPFQAISQQSPQVVPTRTGLTTEDGRANFKDLPLVAPYRLVVKKYGYITHERILPAGSLGNIDVSLELKPFQLAVELLQDVYTIDEVLGDVTVKLEGIKDSHTEGIIRINNEADQLQNRQFDQLLPGRYLITVSGKGSLPSHDIHPVFHARDYVEIHQEGQTDFELALNVLKSRIYGRIMAADTKGLPSTLPADEVFAARPIYQAKAVDQLKWMAAEEDGWLTDSYAAIEVNTDESGYFTIELPPARYGLMLETLNDYWGSHVVLTDVSAPEVGYPPKGPVTPSSIQPRQLIPGFPDFPDIPDFPDFPDIPDIPDLTDPGSLPSLPTGPTRNLFPVEGQGWPFYQTWPSDWGEPPSNGAQAPGHPLVIKNPEYHLEAYLRKQGISLLGNVGMSAVPTERYVGSYKSEFDQIQTVTYSELGDGRGVAKLVPMNAAGGDAPSLTEEESTANIQARTPVLTLGSGAQNTTARGDFVFFENAPPGSYNLQFTHPRFTFEPASLPVEIPTWQAPGVLPSESPLEAEYPEPMTVMPLVGPGGFLDPTLVFADYTLNGATIQLSVQQWVEPEDGSDPFYETVEELSWTQMVNNNGIAYLTSDDAPGKIFANPQTLPSVGFSFWAPAGSAWYYGTGPGNHTLFIGGPSDNTESTDDSTGLPSNLNLPMDSSGGGENGEPVLIQAVNASDQSVTVNGLQITLAYVPDIPNLPDIPGLPSFSLPAEIRNVTSGEVAYLDLPDLTPVAIASHPSGWEGIPTDEILDTDEGPLTVLQYTDGISLDGIPRKVLKVFVQRGLVVTGTTRIQTEPPAVGLRVPGSVLQLRDRFGVILAESRADSRGDFEIVADLATTKTIQGGEPFYLQVLSPGFKVWRKRFTQADVAVSDGESTIDVSVNLEPLPGPEILEVTFDRQGKFLPGIQYETDGIIPKQALDELSLTWTVKVDTSPIEYAIEGFDDATGSQGPMETITVHRDPEDVYLMSQRGLFTIADTPDQPFVHELPINGSDQPDLRRWLNDGLTGASPNVHHDEAQRLSSPSALSRIRTRSINGGDIQEFSGLTLIHHLPSGKFRPVLAIRDRNGTVSVHKAFGELRSLGENAGDVPHLLEGLPVPTWLASAANRFALVSNAQALGNTVEQISEALGDSEPKGRFQSLPQISANIEILQEGSVVPSSLTGNRPRAGASTTIEPNFLRYTYNVAVNWNRGFENSGKDWLALFGDVIGLQFEADATMGMSALMPDRSFFLEVNGSTTPVQGDSPGDLAIKERRSNTLKEKLIPRQLKGVLKAGNALNLLEVDVAPRLAARANIIGGFDAGDQAYQFEIDESIGASVQLRASLPVGQFFAAVPPPVGPVLLNLDRTQFLSPSLNFHAGLGGAIHQSWATTAPVPLRPGNDHVSMQHFLGGNELDSVGFTLGMEAGFGLELVTLGGRGRLSGELYVAGETNPLIGFPALQLDINLDGDWPPLKKIHGSIGARVEAELDVWIVNLGKSWEWDLIPVNIELGTDPVFDLRPVSTSTVVRSPSNSEPEAFQANNDLVIDDFYRAGSFDLARPSDGDKAGLVYTGIDPDNGRMTLMFSRQSETGFAEPRVITESDGMISSSIVALGGESWMAIWCEIQQDDLLNPYPQSKIKSSITDNGGQTWSTPVTLIETDGVCREIEAAVSDEEVAVAMVHTTAGPTSPVANLMTSIWNGSTWSEPDTIMANEAIRSVRLVRKGSWALAALKADGTLLGANWTNTTPGPWTTLATHLGNALDLILTPDNQLALAWADADGNLLTGILNPEVSAITSQQVLLNSVQPNSIKWAPGFDANPPTLTWSQGFQSRELRIASLSQDLQSIQNQIMLIGPSVGSIRSMEPVLDHQGNVGLLSLWDRQTSSLKIWNKMSSATREPIIVENVRVNDLGELMFDVTGPEGTFVRLEQSSDFLKWFPVEDIAPVQIPATLSTIIQPGAFATFFRIHFEE